MHCNVVMGTLEGATTCNTLQSASNRKLFCICRCLLDLGVPIFRIAGAFSGHIRVPNLEKCPARGERVEVSGLRTPSPQL